MWSRLGQLPDDLEKAYDELFINIRSQRGSAPIIAECAFKWVMCSVRPLDSTGLVAAVRRDTSTGQVQQVDVSIDFVLYACSNLLVVDPIFGTCAFSHLSVQEYLERRVWSKSQAHALAAKTCLVVLLGEAPPWHTSVVWSNDRITPQLVASFDDGGIYLHRYAVMF